MTISGRRRQLFCNKHAKRSSHDGSADLRAITGPPDQNESLPFEAFVKEPVPRTAGADYPKTAGISSICCAERLGFTLNRYSASKLNDSSRPRIKNRLCQRRIAGWNQARKSKSTIHREKLAKTANHALPDRLALDVHEYPFFGRKSCSTRVPKFEPAPLQGVRMGACGEWPGRGERAGGPGMHAAAGQGNGDGPGLGSESSECSPRKVKAGGCLGAVAGAAWALFLGANWTWSARSKVLKASLARFWGPQCLLNLPRLP